MEKNIEKDKLRDREWEKKFDEEFTHDNSWAINDTGQSVQPKSVKSFIRTEVQKARKEGYEKGQDYKACCEIALTRKAERQRIKGIVEGKQDETKCELLEGLGYHSKDCWDTCCARIARNKLISDLLKEIDE